MLLTIDGAPRQLIPIKEFRAAHALPPEFGVALFEPKDWTGLGRIDRAGAELNSVRVAMLAAIPEKLSTREWLAFVPGYARLFENKLYEINAEVGLKDVEIEFAVAGLSDVCQGLGYRLLTPPPVPLPVNEEGGHNEKPSNQHQFLAETGAVERKIKTPVPWQTPREIYDALKPLAREKRNEPTPAEAGLWQYLRDKQFEGYKFRQQHTIDRFIVDFYCHEAQLVIEVDGEIHQYTREEDALRQAFLESAGLRVLRFTNNEVLRHIQDVLKRISLVLNEIRSVQSSDVARPPFSPAGRGMGGGVNSLFHAVYTDWLNNSVRVFSTVYPYTHHDQPWGVQIFAHAYGRAGLIVRTPSETYYVHDPALGCPAEGFMTSLMREITEKVEAATGRGG